MVDRSRGRGILNERQRAYLVGESDIEPGTPAERSIRQSIRENLRNALLDFSILERNLDERDRVQVFDAFDSEVSETDSGDASSQYQYDVALGELLAFVYRGVSGREPSFEQLLQYAIPRGEHPTEAPFYPEYEIELTIDQLSLGPAEVEQAIRRVRNDDLDGLTESEARAFLRLLRAGDTVDLEDLFWEYTQRLEAVEESTEGIQTEELTLREFLNATSSWQSEEHLNKE